MKILYVSHGFTTHDDHFLAGLYASGHDVFFLALNGIPTSTRVTPGVHLIPMPQESHLLPLSTFEGLFARMPIFDNAILDTKPDLIHAGPVPTASFMASLTGFHPLVSMSWGSDLLLETKQMPSLDWTARYALKRTDLFVCDSNSVRDRFFELSSDFDSDMIVQFPWGTDLEVFKPGVESSLRSKLGWDHNLVFLSTRSWEEIYGITTLIEAFEIAYKKNNRLRLLMLGDGSQREVVSFMLKNKGLENVVYRAGKVDHVALPEYFCASDFYVSCSISDGTSVSLLEAMATGLPAIVSDIDGNREWVSVEKTGWLANANDAGEFARRILQASSLDDRGKELMSVASRQVVEQKANWSKNFPLLIRGYEKLSRNVERV